jgi:protein AIR1/2
MADEIIDLTTPPPKEYITPERPISPQPRTDDENRRSRRKRRKRESVVRGDRPQTRDHSLEEGELNGKFIQERELHHSGENDNLKRKRRAAKHHSRSPRQSSPPRSPTDTTPLFFVDVEPVPIPAAHILDPSTVPDELGDKLLLPAHVSIFGLAPVEILPTSNTDLDDEDYIEYLDYDDRKVGGKSPSIA